MDIEKLFKDLGSYLDNLDSGYLIGPSIKTKIKDAMGLMRCHIDILSKDESIEDFDPKTTPRVIEESLNLLTTIVSENQIDTEFKKFCMNYCFLVGNWNGNVFKNSVIDSKIQYILRVAQDSMSLDDMLSMLKHLNKKLEAQLGFRPPAFELSAHYYNLIKG